MPLQTKVYIMFYASLCVFYALKEILQVYFILPADLAGSADFYISLNHKFMPLRC